MDRNEWFLVIAMFVYLTGLFIDVGISYSVFAKTPQYFIEWEQADPLVHHLKGGGSFFSAPIIHLVTIFPVLMLMHLFVLKDSLILRKRTQLLMEKLFQVFAVFLIVLGIWHIHGGMSWLLFIVTARVTGGSEVFRR